MAASMVRPRLSGFLTLSRCLREAAPVVSNVEFTSICVVQRRLLHMSKTRNKNDKFNLSSQNTRKRKYRYEDKQKDLIENGGLLSSFAGSTPQRLTGTTTKQVLASLHVNVMTGKLQTFKFDSLPGDTTNNTSTIRQDSLASTLQQAMTSLLEGNEVDPELIDYNIEITQVKIARDIGHVTFYWRSMDGDGHDENIEKLLQSNQNAIRLLLPSYHHLHISPRVIFSRDKQAQYLVDIDTLLLESRHQDKQ